VAVLTAVAPERSTFISPVTVSGTKTAEYRRHWRLNAAQQRNESDEPRRRAQRARGGPSAPAVGPARPRVGCVRRALAVAYLRAKLLPISARSRRPPARIAAWNQSVTLACPESSGGSRGANLQARRHRADGWDGGMHAISRHPRQRQERYEVRAVRSLA
jgi:hypothetical protein